MSTPTRDRQTAGSVDHGNGTVYLVGAGPGAPDLLTLPSRRKASSVGSALACLTPSRRHNFQSVR